MDEETNYSQTFVFILYEALYRNSFSSCESSRFDYDSVYLNVVQDNVYKGDVCSACENYVMSSEINKDSINDCYVSMSIELKPSCSFLQKNDRFILKFSIFVCYEDKLILSKRKICTVTEDKQTKFEIYYYSTLSSFHSNILSREDYDRLRVRCTISKLTNNLPKSIVSQKTNFIKSSKSLLNNETLSDVVLNIKNELKIPAHKTILYLSSPYFEKMFTHQNVENINNEVKIDFEYEPFWEVLKYMYTQEVEKLETLGMEIFKIAHYYQMDDLISICEKFLKTNLLPGKNLLEVLKMADIYESFDLKCSCINEFIQIFNTDINKEDVTELLKVRPNLGYELISHLHAKLPSNKNC